MVKLILGAAYWARPGHDPDTSFYHIFWGSSPGLYWAASEGKGYNLLLYFTKGYLIVKHVPRTTLASPTDWLNLLGPSILALFIIVVDMVEVWLSFVKGMMVGEAMTFSHL